ncbi:Uncharacterized protein HZ326_16093 [Fusarium oxysporum f. sp. albedinis]|nr:Uncharacterized protein HZ326_16093 [Fusarium oxysporum f. sp. albedinis]
MGKLNQSQLACYYLREAIGFIEALGLDETNTYMGLDMETAQRRCRIFLLLFITAWRDQPPSSTVAIPQRVSQSTARYLRRNDLEGVPSDIEETQRVDIQVTRYWLRVLVCQLQIGHTPQAISTAQRSNTHYVLDTSRNL